MKHNILIIGAGGREHALAWKIKQSPLCGTLYCAPGNGGMEEIAECISLADHDAIIEFCKNNSIGLVVVGPEQPFVDGLADDLQAAGIPCFGCNGKAAQLEGSKAFTKALCKKYNIPTAAYDEFTDAQSAKNYLAGKTYPQVIKADGLAAGKGVIIAENEAQAFEAIEHMFSGGFGEAGSKIIIEEFLTGPELSYFALCDGNAAVEFGAAQDHKRAYDNDEGPNTGGMGTYSPPPIATPELCNEIMRTVIEPTIAGLKQEGIAFKGIFFAGFMLTKDGPKLLEYNVRFGDPETQALMARLDTDILPLFLDVASGTLKPQTIAYKPEAAVCVVMASKGYPGAYEKGTVIEAVEQANALPNTTIFHAGTKREDNTLKASGGRVLGVTALGATLKEAQSNAYQAVDTIEWPMGFCRRDIAKKAIA